MMEKDNTANRYKKSLKKIVNIKLGWLLTLLLIASPLFYALALYWQQDIYKDSFLFSIGGFFNIIAGATFGVAIIGFAYEWLVRNETSKVLSLEIKNHLQKQKDEFISEMNLAIPKSLLFDKSLIKDITYSDEKVDDIIKSALFHRLKSHTMTNSIYNGLLNNAISYKEFFEDLRLELVLSNLDKKHSLKLRNEFFSISLNLRYKTKLKSNKFIFARVLNPTQFNKKFKESDYIFTWRIEESALLPKESPLPLNLSKFSIDEIEFEKSPHLNENGGVYEIICKKADTEYLIGKEVTIRYTVNTLLRKHDHVFFYSTVRPTNGIKIIFDYAKSDIESVLVYDFFVSSKNPHIYKMPEQAPHMEVIEMDDWIFPKGGAAFVWRLKGED